MTNDFDDELKRMDELEQVSEAPINKALTLEDAISDLESRCCHGGVQWENCGSHDRARFSTPCHIKRVGYEQRTY